MSTLNLCPKCGCPKMIRADGQVECCCPAKREDKQSYGEKEENKQDCGGRKKFTDFSKYYEYIKTIMV